ncbi:hypothetical protein OIU78_002238 [Salix suchowensis]|nr:hypothetical protein OIU78_002238 [Salix suchowensis]
MRSLRLIRNPRTAENDIIVISKNCSLSFEGVIKSRYYNMGTSKFKFKRDDGPASIRGGLPCGWISPRCLPEHPPFPPPPPPLSACLFSFSPLALVLAVLRWILAWALRFKNRTHLASPSSDSPQQSQPVPSPQQIRCGLILTTFSDVTERMPGVCDTCAVCLSQLRDEDEVRELRNCCHVFHKDCIDRWVDHDHEHDENHNTCPLCRAPLLTPSQSLARTRSEPSWAVERILYLFGDDLMM